MHYVCSDIHGQYGLYKAMRADLRLSKDDTLYILGDVIDRGPAIFPLLLDVMDDPRVCCLLGNHEWLMADYAAGDSQNGRWFLPGNTGDRTWAQFQALPESVRARILRFINARPLQAELTVGGVTFLLSHSFFLADRGTVPCWRDVPDADVYWTVWASPWREKQHVELAEYLKDGRIHVIGHVPAQHIARLSGQACGPDAKAAVFPEYHLVNVDLGCARIPTREDDAGEGLCCLCLEDYAAGREAFRYYRAAQSMP